MRAACRSEEVLEAVPQAKLHGSWNRECLQAGDLTDAAAGQIVHRKSAVYVVESVEILPGKVKYLALGEVEVLAQCPVRREERWSSQRVASSIALLEGECRIRLHLSEGQVRARIEAQTSRHVDGRICHLERS